MLSTSHPPSSLREQIVSTLHVAAHASFAVLLFISPLTVKQTLVTRPLSNIFGGYSDFVFYLSDAFVLLTLGLWFLSLLVSPRPLSYGPWYLTVPVVGLVVLSCLGIITGIDRELTLYHSVRFTVLFALYLFLVNEVIAPLWIAGWLALAVIVQSAVAIAQFIAQHSIGLIALGELELDPVNEGTSIVRLGSERILRAYGLTEHPNILGGFLAFALILILGYYLWAAHTRARYFVLPPLAVGIVALFLTFSRAAALAFVAGAAVIVGAALLDMASRRRRALDLALAGIVVAVALAFPLAKNQTYVAQRIGLNNSFNENSGENRSLVERDALIASTNRIFYKHAVVGVGNGALPIAMLKLDDQFPTEFYYQPAHFVLLDAAAELGLFGGMFWLWLIIAPAVAFLLVLREGLVSPWLAAIAGLLIALTLIGFFDYYPWLSAPGRIWQWSAWGLYGQVIALPSALSSSR